MNLTRDIADTAVPGATGTPFSWIIPMMAILVIAAALWGGAALAVARYAALAALALQALVEVRAGRNRFMTSPLFLLGALTATFFSVLQGIWGRGFAALSPRAVYVGSFAESVILAFAMICLLVYALASRSGRESRRDGVAGAAPRDSALPFLFIALVIAVSLLDAVLYRMQAAGGGALAVYPQVRFCSPALVSFSLMYLARAAVGRGPTFGVAVTLTALFAAAALVSVHEGKFVIFIVCALSLYVARLHDLGLSRLLLAGTVILVVGLVMIQVVQMVRAPHLSALAPIPSRMPATQRGDSGIAARLAYIAVYKGVWRQTETGYCFANVLADHGGQSFDLARQGFWLVGLIPRVLWPGKPSLSLGRTYAKRYCRLKLNPSSTHSASITLLGQPVIHGGWTGLFVHVGLLLLALAAVERLNADPRALRGAVVAALLPYLVDFDQDFALYVANAVKFTLVMGVLFLPAAAIERRGLVAAGRGAGR